MKQENNTLKNLGLALCIILAVLILFGSIYLLATNIKKNKAELQGVQNLRLNLNNRTVRVGEDIVLVANSKTIEDIEWKSDDEMVAIVKAGVVSGISPGEAKISALQNGFEVGSCIVTVVDDGDPVSKNVNDPNNIEVKSISFPATLYTINADETLMLDIIIEPSNATNKEITLTSSNNRIAYVKKDKTVTGISDGYAIITAKSSNGLTASARVEVTGRSVNYDKYMKEIDDLENGIIPEDPVDPGEDPGKGGDNPPITQDPSEQGGTTTVPVTGIRINKTSLALTKDATYTLTAIITPSNATNKTVTWSSSNTAIATVSSSGKVTAKNAGTAVITARAGKVSATCNVTVTINNGGGDSGSVAVTSISLSHGSITGEVGYETTVYANVSPSNATDKTITWTSSNTAIATVSSTGHVKIMGVGTATITARASNGVKATCNVTGKSSGSGGGGFVNAEGITLNKSSVTLKIGETTTLVATITPSDTTNKIVYWSSSDTTVASVVNGKVTAIKTGTATITATTHNGKRATCTITVSKIAPTGISLDKETASVVKTNQVKLTATVTPSNADQTVTWSSGNTTVATVNNLGYVTGKKVGSAKITAKTSNNLSAQCTVTVTQLLMTRLYIPSDILSVNVGSTVTVVPAYEPTNADNTSFTWSSSNTTVATVDGSGKVKGLKEGSVTITVKSSNNLTATAKVTVKKVPVTSVEVGGCPSSPVSVGSDFQLTATVKPSNATYKTIEWISGNTTYATVSNTGKVHAKKSTNGNEMFVTAKTPENVTGVCRFKIKD